MIFYDNKGHHLDEVTYSFDKKDPMKTWIFKSNDDRVNMVLKPTHVERSGMNFIILKTKVLKAYGFFVGDLILDDATKISITEEDRVFGSAEAVVNYW